MVTHAKGQEIRPLDSDGTPGDVRPWLKEHHGAAFAWAVSCCNGDRTMAEDVLQTSYLKILDGRARFRGESSFRTWLFSVVRNTARDAARSFWHRKRRPITEWAPRTVEIRPEETNAELDLEQLARALDRLPRRQAQVLSLVYGHGLVLREVAEVLGISQGSASTHLHRGKRRLRARLGRSAGVRR